MTEHQLLAMDELNRIEEMQVRSRLLSLKLAHLTDDLGLGSAWPEVGVVPNAWHRNAYHDPYIERKQRKNNPDYKVYAFEAKSSKKDNGDGRVINAIDLKMRIERQIQEIAHEIQELEQRIIDACSPYPAEVLLRRYIYRQRWQEIGDGMRISVESARSFYYGGLEQFGSKLENK